MSLIDITKGFRQYSPEDLRGYALKGLVCCGNEDLSEFLEYLLQGTYSSSELDEAKENAYDEGYEAGRCDSPSGEISDDVLEQIQKAINILKEI